MLVDQGGTMLVNQGGTMSETSLWLSRCASGIRVKGYGKGIGLRVRF